MARPPEICPIHCLLQDGTRKTACVVVMEGPTLSLPRFGEAGLGPLCWLGLGPWIEWGPDGGEVASAICIWSLHTLQPHALIPSMKAGPWELSAPRGHLTAAGRMSVFSSARSQGHLSVPPPTITATLNNVSSQKHFQEPVVSTNPDVFRLLYIRLHVSMAVSVVQDLARDVGRFFLLFSKKLLIYFLAALGLGFCMRAFSRHGSRELLSSYGARASHCAGSSCRGAWAVGTWAPWLQLSRSRVQAQ